MSKKSYENHTNQIMLNLSIYIYKTECVYVSVCVFHFTEFTFLTFFKIFMSSYRVTTRECFRKPELKYLLYFLNYSRLKLRNRKNYVKKTSNFYIREQFLTTYLNLLKM